MSIFPPSKRFDLFVTFRRIISFPGPEVLQILFTKRLIAKAFAFFTILILAGHRLSAIKYANFFKMKKIWMPLQILLNSFVSGNPWRDMLSGRNRLAFGDCVQNSLNSFIRSFINLTPFKSTHLFYGFGFAKSFMILPNHRKLQEKKEVRLIHKVPQ